MFTLVRTLCQTLSNQLNIIALLHFNLNFQDSDILNLGTGSTSWFEVNGYGCVPTYPTNITSEDPYRFVRPEFVEGCLLQYSTIEIIHSSVQLFFAVNIYIDLYFHLICPFDIIIQSIDIFGFIFCIFPIFFIVFSQSTAISLVHI